jgi:integrase
MKGHIRQRSPGHWAIILDLPGDKRRRKWHSFKGTKREAQVECARLIAELTTGTYLEPNKTTVAEFLDRWLEHIGPRVSPKTLERYAEIARNNLVPLLGSVIITKLQPVQVSAAYAKALTKLSPRTVNHMHRVLKQAMGQAVRWQLLLRNPLDVVDPPRVERKRLHTYDVPQTAELLELVRGTSMFIPTLLAVLCGLRRGEIAALRWRSVDFETGQIAVIESVEQMNRSTRIKEPKSGRTRTVAMSATVADELRSHRTRQAEQLLKIGIAVDADTFVSTYADSRGMRPHQITQDWDRLTRRLSLPRIRFHDLRHAHATHLLASGVHPKSLVKGLATARSASRWTSTAM